MTELNHNELVAIDGGLIDPISVSAFLVGSFLAGVAIGISLRD